MKKIYALLSVILSVTVIAQENSQIEICGSDHVNQELMKKDPEFAQRIQEFDQKLSKLIKSGKMSNFYKNADQVYEIPVVVHVIHDGGAIGTQYNKSDAAIQAWVNFANQVYEGTNPNIGSGTRSRIPIRFVLAKRDMNCNPTNGIVRINGSVLPGYSNYGVSHSGSAGASQTDIKALSRWDPKYYYNIYVVKYIGGPSGGVAGFAYYPGSLINDGSFMLSSVVNTSSTTFPHEMGHAMGLRHTFNGDGSSCLVATGDCTRDDDMVCDTERSLSALNDYPCKTNSDINICTGSPYQGVQYNIMNYGSCRDRFTLGQSDRAIAHLLEFRGNQINSKGGIAPVSSENYGAVVSACTPTSITNANICYEIGPANVKFGDIDYKSYGYCSDSYQFYVDHTTERCASKVVSTEIPKGVSTPLTISTSVYDSNTQNVRAYIDYDNDGVFDPATETVFSKQITGNSSATVDVSPPATAVLNTPLRMRVIADLQGVPIYPCYNPVYGQVEDFTVIINATMGTEDPANTEGLKVYTHNQSVFIVNNDSDIQEVEVYNMTGQKIFVATKLSQTQYEIPFEKMKGEKVVIVKIQTADKKNTTKKVLIK